eukprot:COSAG06_NODE_943_length_11375_cov_11.840635_12_plen_262_part_00
MVSSGRFRTHPHTVRTSAGQLPLSIPVPVMPPPHPHPHLPMTRTPRARPRARARATVKTLLLLLERLEVGRSLIVESALACCSTAVGQHHASSSHPLWLIYTRVKSLDPLGYNRSQSGSHPTNRHRHSCSRRSRGSINSRVGVLARLMSTVTSTASAAVNQRSLRRVAVVVVVCVGAISSGRAATAVCSRCCLRIQLVAIGGLVLTVGEGTLSIVSMMISTTSSPSRWCVACIHIMYIISHSTFVHVPGPVCLTADAFGCS